MVWSKQHPDGREYARMREYFGTRPAMLVDCGFFREDERGVHYFYSTGSAIADGYITYAEIGRRPVKRTLTELAEKGGAK